GVSQSFTKKDLSGRSFDFDAAYMAPGHIPLMLIKEIISKLKRKKCFVAMNPSGFYLKMGVEKLRPILKNLDLIILNREEGAALTGRKYKDEKGIFRKFDEMVSGLAVMTDGPKGVMVSDGNKICRAGIYKEKKLVDRTGAGDAFGSGFVAGLLQNVKIKNKSEKLQFKVKNFREEDIIRGIKLGSANATSNVEEVGAQSGILTKRQFKTQARWKNLPVKVYNMS
ncbi:MAG: carbohydrate kinase family protein, partial [Candidatus Liptonbacteria bacterium]|nr:carbohydrate kinase family protein [Candidatus Liptonbacteria bacterium]